MRPVLDEFSSAVDNPVKPVSVVWTETREQDHQVGRNQDVNVV